jgi:hypothetical protein
MTQSALFPIIGIAAGRPGSGKSTLAEHFVQQEGFRKIAFAAPLKDLNRRLLLNFGYTTEQADRLVYVDKEVVVPELGRTCRHIQRTLGTEWGRDLIGPDLWVDLWKWQIWTARLRGDRGVVCDDMRFRNELSVVRELGGVAIYVDRPLPPVPWWKRLFSKSATHRSEGAIRPEDADLRVRNSSTLADFRQVCRVVPAYAFERISANPETADRLKKFESKMAAVMLKRSVGVVTAVQNSDQ